MGGPVQGGVGRCCLGTPCRGLRAGAYARVRLPQFYRAERQPEHARSAHWTAAPSLPRRFMWIGRLRLKKAGGAWRATAAAGFGGRLGRPGPFLPLSPGGADRTTRAPAFLFTRRHKMAAPEGGATAGVRETRSPLPPAAEHVPVPAGLGGSVRAARGRTLPRQHRSAAEFCFAWGVLST